MKNITFKYSFKRILFYGITTSIIMFGLSYISVVNFPTFLITLVLSIFLSGVTINNIKSKSEQL